MDLKRSRRRKMPAIDPAKIDRLPPHSTEAEQGVLGCLMWSPNDCMNDCIAKFKGDQEIFYDLRHQTIYNTIQAMYDKREAELKRTVERETRAQLKERNR